MKGEHWARLRTAIRLNPSKSEIDTACSDDDVSFLPMEAIGEDGSLSLDRTRPLSEVQSGYTYFRDGDVLIAKITPCFENGKGAVARGLINGFGFGTTELIVARPRLRQLAPAYLYWITQSPDFRQWGEGAMYGAGGQKRVPDDFVLDYRAWLPPVPEQLAIATFLERETCKIDALVEEQRRLIELLSEKRGAVISQAVTKGLNPKVRTKPSGVAWLDDVPEHWQVRSISSISTKITNGYVGPTRDVLVENGIRYLQSLHIKQNSINFDQPYFVTKEWSEAHSKSILAAGDVLIVQTGDIGQVAVVSPEFEGCNCHALIIVAPLLDAITGEWLSWVLNAPYGRHSLLSIQTGALHPHLNCGNVKDLFVPVPPVPEQVEIVRELERNLASLSELAERASDAIRLLQERRRAIISAAVTGKIDMSNKSAQEEAA
jgi:type I restriction enzyme, S subunit